MSGKHTHIKTKNKTMHNIDNGQRQPAIVFLSISLALFIAFVGFFAWHTAIMRNYELNYLKTSGTIVGVEEHHSSSTHRGARTYYYFVISYSYDGQDYKFTDRTGHRYYTDDQIGASTVIYVNPQNPARAEKVTSSRFVSIICACFFAFFCATYAAGMNILLSIKGNSLKKRLLFVWGVEIILGIAFLLLSWLGLPKSGFGELFTRTEGAVGLTVILGLVMCVTLLDGIITYKTKKA